MIINSAPKNEAVISNVGEIGEFRIQQSAEAFGILSSGLYANKIRAVIRELSCNAVDSHVSAGRTETPFDVHLPNSLEPWFAVRDYGVGLDHAQISKIYTTYFMSTKGESNDQIGGLGLGSKSPFSYTDNFTVTTSKDGVKGIYTAFINESGVPSIALMTTSETTDPNGVEVKFSVNDRSDFGKFEQEAEYVFRTFTLQPVVSGSRNFVVKKTKYVERDVVPGVHYLGSQSQSVAIMGNVPYPINVPNAETNLGQLASLLSCGLELNFAIGEIKFQASREGLSYVPETIAAIKAKLEALNAVLAVKVAGEANAIACMYARQSYLATKHGQSLFANAVVKYCNDTKFPLVNLAHLNARHFNAVVFSYAETELASKYNIKITGFSKSSYYNVCSTLRTRTEVNPGFVHSDGSLSYRQEWFIGATQNLNIVVNDTTVGATERAKFHWKKNATNGGRHEAQCVYVLSKADKDKDMLVAEFLATLHNPPSVVKASTMDQKERKGAAGGAPITLMKLTQRGGNNRTRYDDKVWRDAGKLTDLEPKRIHYYLEVSGFTATVNGKQVDMTELVTQLDSVGISGLRQLSLYGVRKADLDAVKNLKNWVKLETLITEKLLALDQEFWMSVLKSELDTYTFLRYNSTIKSEVKAGSLFLATYSKFDKVSKVSANLYNLSTLLKGFAPTIKDPLTAMRQQYVRECGAIYAEYPLLKHLSSSAAHNTGIIAEYINLIDSKKESI